VGTLYVVSAPAGDPDDLSLRAIRILGEVDLIVAEDVDQAQRLLAHHGFVTPLASGPEYGQAADVALVLEALERGDAALLTAGWSPGPSEASARLVAIAVERGFPAVPVPGPVLPVTALVVSGLPADSFVYLGELPQQPSARRSLLASIAGERRTLIVRETPQRLPETLAELRAALGGRPLAVVEASGEPGGTIWRGTLNGADDPLLDRPGRGPLALIVGGAREEAAPWDEDRLAGEIRAGLGRGLRASEISRQLAVESGWPRREIYRRAVKMAQFPSEP
jgi:16S rRNA (cytidine1402-2'-O)-methyltransferase